MSSTNTTTSVAGDANASFASNMSSVPTNSTSVQKTVLSILMDPEFLATEAKIVISALAIIWLGSHASLRRPPSAARPKTKAKGGKKPKEEPEVSGFSAGDAIVIPVVSACVLISFYYIIQWLKDPYILNKILQVYFSVATVGALGFLVRDALDILTSLVFPSIWADRRGNIFHVDSQRCCQVQVQEDGTTVETSKSPFPGYLASVSLSPRALGAAWEVRYLLTEKWTARFAMHGLGSSTFELEFNALIGFLLAGSVSVWYHTTGGPMLSNILASSLSYSALTLLSPTSFTIGSMVLAGLFVYDIVMVFYTPFMIGVATKVQAPIMLVFPTTGGGSLLGLGDIIIPGLLVGLALRFDLHRYYQKKIKMEPVELVGEVDSGTGEGIVKTVTTKYKRVKAPYVDSERQWGNRLWTTRFGSILPIPEATSVRAATAFPKPYFYASIIGYTLGLLVTLLVLLIFKHGQPALLYLVPGVTGSIWVTAWWRGEVKEAREYTEDGSLDTEDVIVEVDANGEVKEVEDSAQGKKSKDQASTTKEGTKEVKEANVEDGVDYDVLLFSITAPRHAALKQD